MILIGAYLSLSPFALVDSELETSINVYMGFCKNSN